MKRLSRYCSALVLALATFAAPAALDAAPLDHAAQREIVLKTAPAVIAIEVVVDIKYNYGGQSGEQERKFDALATVVSADGLAVTALSQLDPSAMYAKMMRSDEDSFSSRIKSLKYILSDNSEVPAAVLLRDAELDLIFLKPTQAPAEPMTFVDLSKAGTPEILDPAFVVGRTGRISRRSVIGMSGEIQSVVKLPRRYYIPSAELVSAGVGTPIFSATDGSLYGLVVIYANPAAAEAMETGEEPSAYIILPAMQIEDVAKQAAEAKPEELTAEPESEATENEVDPVTEPAGEEAPTPTE